MIQILVRAVNIPHTIHWLLAVSTWNSLNIICTTFFTLHPILYLHMLESDYDYDYYTSTIEE